MSSDRTQTLTVGEDSGPETQPPVPHLVYLLTADRLGASSCRVRLRPDRGSHVFGRGRELGCATSPDGIVVSVPDPRMSSVHARLEPVGSRWRVEDLGSKNGTLVDGLAVDTPRLLADGDLLELGHSFFLYREMVSTWPELDDAPQSLGDEGPVSLSGPLVARYRDLARVAPSDLPVLLRGESGVGKEVAARALHALSGRRGRCVAVNCGALPETLVESELFGVRKGAFSGAHADRKGLVEEAGEGTLFLDEIGELPPSAQTKLLRVLQERCVVPVGATRPVPVNFRLVAATHRDLEKDVREERFRGDLFSRIAGYALVLPPLRERREDLGLLVRQIVAEAGHELDEVQLSRSLARALLRHPWTYNVRELKKVLLVALTLAEGGELSLEHAGLETGTPPAEADGADDEHDLETRLRALLAEHEGNISQVARSMGKARMQIHRWLKRFDIDTEAYRPK